MEICTSCKVEIVELLKLQLWNSDALTKSSELAMPMLTTAGPSFDDANVHIQLSLSNFHQDEG